MFYGISWTTLQMVIFLQKLYLQILFFVKWLLILILFCYELDFSPFTEYVTSNSCLVIISIHSTRNSFCSINILFFSYSVNSAFASKNTIGPKAFWNRIWNLLPKLKLSARKKVKQMWGLRSWQFSLKMNDMNKNNQKIKRVVAISDLPAKQLNQCDSTPLFWTG